MAAARLEHVNIRVSDPDRTARLLADITGWQERWRGPAIDDGRTIHLGAEFDYIALYTPREPVTGTFPKGAPLQHVGIVVDDLDAAERMVERHGLTPFNHADYAPGRRFYFYDWDGIEFELVSYA
ncbi:VOC family protein [Novosphingobium sp. KCTC 2891]|uniref:VOC family protein n=1 Tax=Novosphingobium sp. KCTC 2891 TaxID=2989730 RepID=UPI0022237695|nr:VOC family protein [Novosphingobium sp. KCTC 2891]MCW1382604.1 VOC family protein [Novosphingobium sp. KCTC 2891]